MSVMENTELERLSEGIYKYSDRYSKVFYKRLKTNDEVIVPSYGVFTLPPLRQDNDPEIKYCGVVSEDYQFSGNENVINQVKESIGNALFTEKIFLNPSYTQMRSELVISNKKSIKETGDIYPQVIVENSYNGSKRVAISFGLMIHESEERRTSFAFRDKIATYSQIHLTNAKTRSTEIGIFVQAFNQNISQIVQENLNSKISDKHILHTLDFIERIGKRKRESLSMFLSEMKKDLGDQMSAWHLFLVIAKFSSVEKNLNIKTYLENAAERVLVIPTRMFEMLKNVDNIFPENNG